MIKLIATDLDGTLFYPKRRFTLMTRRNKKFLRDFYKSGGEIILVTGRSKRVPDKVANRLDIKASVLGCNGAFFYEDNTYKYDHPINQQLFLKVYMKLRRNYGIIGWLLLDNTDKMKVSAPTTSSMVIMFARLLNKFNFSYAERYVMGETQFLDAVSQGKCYKLMPVFGLGKRGEEKAKAAQIALLDTFGDRLDITLAGVSLEITLKGINKGNALKDYLKLKNIKEDEVIVVGNADNDISMLSQFKYSFAMKSGEANAKRVSNYLVDEVSDIRDFIMDENGNMKEFSIPESK